MLWQDVPIFVDRWKSSAAVPASDLRRAVSVVHTADDVGYYWHPTGGKAAVYGAVNRDDFFRCKAAAARAVGHGRVLEHPLTKTALTDVLGCWIKVAYSPTLRRTGELLNFFPGQYVDGIPNAASPLAAMLTSGAVGAGLGWGTGKVLEKISPRGYGKKLGRTGAILGALLGAAPGAALSAASLSNGRSVLEPWPFEGAPQPNNDEALSLLRDIKLGEKYKAASAAFCKAAFGDMFGEFSAKQPPTPLDVNIDALGRTLWEHGASPGLAATAMGTMYAAQQLPSDLAREGWATGDQLGQLALNAAGDYTKGLLVGAALNAVIGTPYSAAQFGGGNAVLGIIGSVVPRLFGR